MPSHFWGWAAVLLYIKFVLKVVGDNKKYSGAIIPIAFVKFLMVFSLACIGSGFFMPEMGYYGSAPSFAAFYTTICCACIISMVFLANNLHLNIKDHQKSKNIYLWGVAEKTSIYFSALLPIYLVFFGIKNGFPLLDGVDRFYYRLEAQDALLNIIINNKGVVCGVLGFLNYEFRERKINMIIFLGIVFSSIMFGEKFLSIIVLFLFYFSTKITKEIIKNKKFINGVVLTSAVFSVVPLCLVYYIYSDYGALPFAFTIEKILGRFASQGQLWFAVANDEIKLSFFNWVELNNLIAVLGSSSADQDAFYYEVGVWGLARKYAHQSIYYSLLDGEGLVQLTGGYEAYFMNSFGVIGLVISLIFIIFYGAFLLFFFSHKVCSGNGTPLSAAIFFFLLIAFNSAWNQGAPWQILGLKSLTYLFILMISDYFLCKLFFVKVLKSEKNSF